MGEDGGVTMADTPVGILAPMPMELRAVVRALSLGRSPVRGFHRGVVGDVTVVATTTGIGTLSATEAVERLLQETGARHVIVVGIAGGLAPGLAIGDVVVADLVRDGASGAEYRSAPFGELESSGSLVTFDELLTDPAELASLTESGFAAIDMETSAIAAVCARRGCPWSAVRSISDRVGIDPVDAELLALAHSDGSPDFAAVARFIVTRPWRLPGLVRLGAYSGRAAAAAAEAARRGCATMSDP